MFSPIVFELVTTSFFREHKSTEKNEYNTTKGQARWGSNYAFAKISPTRKENFLKWRRRAHKLEALLPTNADNLHLSTRPSSREHKIHNIET